MNLSYVEAQAMIAEIQKRLEADKKSAAIAIVDSHGELIAFLRMDGCHLPPISVAVNKAFTAAREGKPSGNVGVASRETPFPMGNFGDPRYTGWAGGFPIIRDERVVGAIGVSGLDEEQETVLARLAIDVIR
jgi:glc operon protein GlcG